MNNESGLMMKESEENSHETSSPTENIEFVDDYGKDENIKNEKNRKKRKRDDNEDSEDEDEDEESEVKRLLANSQERCRMRKLNTELNKLRRCIPKSYYLHHRRLSKIRTLTSAKHYIQVLTDMLQQNPPLEERIPCEQTTRVPTMNADCKFSTPEQMSYPVLLPRQDYGTQLYETTTSHPHFMSTPSRGYRVPQIGDMSNGFAPFKSPVECDSTPLHSSTFHVRHGQFRFALPRIDNEGNAHNSSFTGSGNAESSGSSGYYTDSPGGEHFWTNTSAPMQFCHSRHYENTGNEMYYLKGIGSCLTNEMAN